MSTKEKIKLQEKYGSIQIKCFSSGNPFGMEQIDNVINLQDCISKYQKWVNQESNLGFSIVVLDINYQSTGSKEDGSMCNLVIQYLIK